MSLHVDAGVFEGFKAYRRRLRYERSGEAKRDALRIKEADFSRCGVIGLGKYREALTENPTFDRSYDRLVTGKAGAVFGRMLTFVPRMFWIYHKIDPYDYRRVVKVQHPMIAKRYAMIVPELAAELAKEVNLSLRDPVFQPQVDAVKKAKGMAKLLAMFSFEGGSYRDYNDLDKKGKPKTKKVTAEEQFKMLELIAAAGSPKLLRAITRLAGKTNVATLVSLSILLRPMLADAAMWIAGAAYLQAAPLRKQVWRQVGREMERQSACTVGGQPIYTNPKKARAWIGRALMWFRIATRLAYPFHASPFEKNLSTFYSYYRGKQETGALAELKARLYGVYEYMGVPKRFRRKLRPFGSPVLSRGVYTNRDMMCRPSKVDSKRRKPLFGSGHLYLTLISGRGISSVTKAFYAAAERAARGGCEM